MAAAAASPASCERPPLSATSAERGGLALTGKPPNRPDNSPPRPMPIKSRLMSGRVPRQAGKRARGGGALHHDDQSNDHRQSENLDEIFGVDQGNRGMGRRDVEGADHRQALTFQP